MNCKNEEMLLHEVMKYQFAVVDTALYLDTHPYDQEALSRHYMYSTRLKQLKAEYEKYHGPLTLYKPQREYWKYKNGPWPREI